METYKILRGHGRIDAEMFPRVGGILNEETYNMIRGQSFKTEVQRYFFSSGCGIASILYSWWIAEIRTLGVFRVVVVIFLKDQEIEGLGDLAQMKPGVNQPQSD